MGAHSRARSRETVSGSGPEPEPEPGGKQGGALCPPAPGRAEARDRGGRAAMARARAGRRARAPARPASSVFVLMEPACSWRVSSHVPRPRGGWAPATGTRGRVADPRTVRKLRRGTVWWGRSQLFPWSSIWVRRHSIPASRLSSPIIPPPGRRLNRGTERTSQVCYITGHRSIYIWLFIQGARCNQPESFRINPGTHSSKLGN